MTSDDDIMTLSKCPSVSVCTERAGTNCIFPFDFDGTVYDTCTTAGGYRPWCYTSCCSPYWYQYCTTCQGKMNYIMELWNAVKILTIIVDYNFVFRLSRFLL